MSDATLGLLPIVLITSVIAIGATAGSIFIKNQTTANNALDQAVTDITNDLTTYLKIDQIIGKYDTPNGIQRLAIHIRPLITGTIDLTKIQLQLTLPDDAFILPYRDVPKDEPTNALFHNPAWDQFKPGSFTIQMITDDDGSALAAHTLNKNTDAGFLLVKLPEQTYLRPYDTLQLTITPTPGQQQTFTFDVPYTTNSLVTLYP